MPSVQILVLINLIVQIVLMGIVFTAVYLAKVKHQLSKHCAIMNIVVIIQIVTVAVVMLPSLLGYIQNEAPGLLSRLELMVHHGLGLLVVALWIYINLAFKGIIKTRWKLVIPMRLAFSAWLVTLILGLHIYLVLWI